MPSADAAPLPLRVRSALDVVADPRRAPAMRAYMKSAMPFVGVPMPALRRALRPVLAGLVLRGVDDSRSAVLGVWRGARFREERYAAIEILGHPGAVEFQRIGVMDVYEELVVDGPWWDLVDPVAGATLWRVLRADPEPMGSLMRDWAASCDMWKRRAAIIVQLPAGSATDRRLLYDAIEPALGSREFFLRKAIGWALRQYARVEPGEVLRYVGENAGRMSPLIRREALKRLPAGSPGS